MKGWTTKQHAMAAGDALADVIAQEIGRTRGAVGTYRWRNGMTKRVRKFTAEDDAHLLKAREVGFMWAEIAEQMNRSVASCYNRWRRLQCQQSSAKAA
jgi:hypothetical protein